MHYHYSFLPFALNRQWLSTYSAQMVLDWPHRVRQGEAEVNPLQAQPHRAQNQAGDTDTNIDQRRKLLLLLQCEESVCPWGYLGGEVLSLLFNATKYVLRWIPSLPLSKGSYGYSLGEMVNLIILASVALSTRLGAQVTGKLNLHRCLSLLEYLKLQSRKSRGWMKI